MSTARDDLNNVFELIKDERERQLKLLDGQVIPVDLSHPDVNPGAKIIFLTEELGEVARAVRNHYIQANTTARFDPTKLNLMEELVQLATHTCTWRASLQA